MIAKRAEETPELRSLLKPREIVLTNKCFYADCQAALSIRNLYKQGSLSKVAPWSKSQVSHRS